MKKIDGKKGGFNLIELLVVMAIIAVLVALVIAAINIARRASRDTERRSNATSIQAALEDHYARHKEYPDTASVDTLGEINSMLDLGTDLEDPNGDNDRYCYKIGVPGAGGTAQTGKYVLRITMESDGDNDDKPSCTAVLIDSSPYEDFSHE